MKNLKRCRLINGLTRHQLAQLTDIPVRTIEEWETITEPTEYAQRLMRVSRVLGVSIEYLIGLDY